MAQIASGWLVFWQNRVGTLVGCPPAKRSALVARMLHRSTGEKISYWLQLVVSVGIATIGLVVGSTAVVIGAMLVSPLMGPIINLGMGLATGSPLLVLRSAGRLLYSVVAVMAFSALITLLLPYHDINAEIAARTSPTALDLVAAAFCALAGVYAALRPGSETATAAAGTSIGISLVPPLCVSGYGIGILNGGVAGGAAMLFLTNVVAIVVVATVSFVAVGFNQVDEASLGRKELLKRRDASVARAVAWRLSALFASKWGPYARILMPLLLLAAVYLPLRSALNEVAWQVRVRSAVTRAVAALPRGVLESRVRLDHHAVDLLVVLLGSQKDADAVRTTLDQEIRRVAGVDPRVEVVAVPDATQFAGLESTLLTAKPAVATAARPERVLDESRAFVQTAVERAWPATSVGEPLEVAVATSGDPLRVRVTHLGSPLDAVGREAIERSLSHTLNRPVLLLDTGLLPVELRSGNNKGSGTGSSSSADEEAFMGALAELVRVRAGLAGLSLCVETPAKRPRERNKQRLWVAVESLLEPQADVIYFAGRRWRAALAPDGCGGFMPGDQARLPAPR